MTAEQGEPLARETRVVRAIRRSLQHSLGFVMLRPLSVGQHLLHFAGSFHFDIGEIGNPTPLDFPLDMTYHITVQ